MHRMILAGSLLLALSTSAAAGQVYKWVDAQGVTHFGAQPPEGQASTPVNTTAPKPQPTPPTPGSGPSTAPKESPAGDQKAIDEKVKTEVAAQEAKRRKYCENARTTLSQLQHNPRLRVNVDGEIRRLGEDERQSRIKEAEKAISENCS